MVLHWMSCAVCYMAAWREGCEARGKDREADFFAPRGFSVTIPNIPTEKGSSSW